MSTVPVRKYTPEEYLALERAAENKSEYFRGEIFAMAGAREPHNAILVNLIAAFHAALAGTPCRVYPSDMRVKCPSGLYTYPDMSIVCGMPTLEDDHGDNLLNPQVIFEILSPSTEGYDRGKKFEHYQSIESFREYVLIAQDRPSAERFVRSTDGGEWVLSTTHDLHGDFNLATCRANVRMADIYRDISFPPPTIADIHPFTVYPDGMPPR